MGEEYEKFEITDYDLDNEFYPRQRRKRTKESETYGIWAEDSEEEDDGKRKKEKNYSAPINFVSGGVKKGSAGPPGGEREDLEDDDDEETKEKGNISTDSEEERMMRKTTLPKSFGSSKGKFKADKVLYREEGSDGADSGGVSGHFAGLGQVGRSYGSGVGIGQVGNERLGEWERHTKGIGKRLLEKMGYKAGSGLGKSGEGIVTPVEASKRAGRGAVGAYGTEVLIKKGAGHERFVGTKRADSEEEEDEKFHQKLSQWRKKSGKDSAPTGKKGKVKYNYRTYDEVVASSPAGAMGKISATDSSKMDKIKVIDMTGKQTKVLQGYASFSSKHVRPTDEGEDGQSRASSDRKYFDMPELLHNLDLLCDATEQEIIQNDRKLGYANDQIVHMKHEHERLHALVENEEKLLKRHRELLVLIEEYEDKAKDDAADPLTLDDLTHFFQRLQEDFYEEYRIYELSSLGHALALPLVRKSWKSWDCLGAPKLGFDTMKELQKLLEDTVGARYTDGLNTESMDPYHRLLWDAWMPPVRATILARWNVRDPEALVSFIELWTPRIPGWILANILDSQIMPKLQSEVDRWDPLTDTVPIHSWIHPWLSLMGARLQPLFAPIRHKLAAALTNWHASDGSAKLILSPWKKVFDQAELQAFILRSIVPKLHAAFAEFKVNPHRQILDQWNWVMAWADMLPTATIVSLLDKHFFPKWTQSLCSWLNHDPNYDEVTKWYLGWKSIIPEAALSHPIVKDKLNQALEIMNRAVSGTNAHLAPGARENVAYLTTTERRARELSPSEFDAVARQRVGAGLASNVHLTFKDLVAKKAEESNVVFVPVPNKFFEAKPVYKFGNVYICIDKQVIFAQEGSLWNPISLSNLVARAK